MSSSNLDKNLENIRRIDQFANKVIEHCTHAALFNFSIEQNKWLKTEVDGPLFIYERLDQPLYSMIVVNRQSPKNFVEPITDGLQLRYEPPYIFVHREDGCIRGLWVFGEDECKRVFDTLTKLSMELKMKSAGATTSSPKNSISNNNESGAVAAFAAATPPPTKIVAAAKPPTPPPSQQQQAIRVSSFISSNSSPFNNNTTKQYTTWNRGTTSSTNTGGGGADAMSTTISSSNTTTATTVGRDVAATTAATIAAVPAPVQDDNRNDSNNNKSSNIVKPYINPNSAKSITTSSSCGRDVAATVATVATVKDDNRRDDSSSNIAMPTNTNTSGRDVATMAELLEKIDVLQRQLDKANGNIEVLQRELDKANGRERLRAENEQLRHRVTELEADTHSLQAVARVLAELEANKHKQKQDGTNDTVAQ
ncbi:hypothetical protein niasHS_013978 [Heterodera schachtii]|uniref:Uncharacterized protein n=1 Tax=Heterodera schachtii TaxID=97005 RepID=A0ABD2IKL9_HETSC